MKMIKELINYNKVEIHKNKVVKTYYNKLRLKNEIKFINIFSNYFITPKILDVKENQVVYERLTGVVELNSKLNDFTLITDLITSFPDVYDIIESNRGLSIDDKKGKLIHGDLRLPNIFLKNNDFALIDFEHAGYLNQNFDFSYLYFSVLGNNKVKLAEQLVNYVKKEGNYLFFLEGCKYYSNAILLNPRLSKENQVVFAKNLIEINKEISKLGIPNSKAL